jgi:lipoate-protein ligase B
MGGWMEFHLYDLGRMKYKDAWDLQKRLVEQRRSGSIPDTLLLVEHDHVITFGKRSPPGGSNCYGIESFYVERGGLATYHGPGQIVGYPIVKLKDRLSDIKKHIWRLEEVLIRCLNRFDIPGERIEGHPGIWVCGKKIASIGVAVNGDVTFHGFALNVNPEMKYFALIQPCGLTPNTMTSMSQTLGREITINDVKPELIQIWEEVFTCTLSRISLQPTV